MIQDGNAESKVLEAALELFQLAGYSATTLEMISQRSGISRNGIRSRFGSKRNILKSLFELERNTVRSKIESVLSSADHTGSESVSSALRSLFGLIRESGFLSMIYRFDDFPVWYCVREVDSGVDPLSGNNSLLESFLEKCSESGTIRPGDVSVISYTYRTMISLVLSEPGMLRGAPHTSSILVDIFVDGLVCATS